MTEAMYQPQARKDNMTSAEVRAAQIHALEAPPAAREGCGDCGKLEEIRGLLG